MNAKNIGIYSNSPEEISNRLFTGAQNYMKEIGGFLARDFCPREVADPESKFLPPWQGQTDGVIICTGRDDKKTDKDMADWVLSGGVPAVVCGSDWVDPRVPRFHVDSRSLAELACKHLTERDCQSFLHVGYKGSTGSTEREKHFQLAIAKCGHEVAGISISHPCIGNVKDLSALKAEKELIGKLRTMKKPIGIWALNDRFAAAIYLLCQELDLAIPKTVKVLGVDDLLVSRTHEMSISTIRTPGERVGWLAMRALHRLLQRCHVSRPATAEPATEVIGRKSTLGKASVQVTISDSQEFIARYACAGLTVEHVAEIMNVSRRTLELQYRALKDRSPREAIQQIRLEKAQDLLRNSGFSMSRIASMIGFAETAAFSKFFRSKTGASPTDYRIRKSKKRL